MLPTLNIYKFPAKEHQVVDSCDAHEILVSEILCEKCLEYFPLILQNFKQVKWTKNVRFTISSILSTQ